MNAAVNVLTAVTHRQTLGRSSAEFTGVNSSMAMTDLIKLTCGNGAGRRVLLKAPSRTDWSCRCSGTGLGC